MRPRHRPFMCLTTQYNTVLREWGERVCLSVKSNPQVLRHIQSFCCTHCSVQYKMSAAHSYYCAWHQALLCVNVFVLQFLSATSMSHVLALSSGRGGLLWCTDLNWSPQTWEGGLWTNTTPSTYVVVRTNNKLVSWFLLCFVCVCVCRIHEDQNDTM